MNCDLLPEYADSSAQALMPIMTSNLIVSIHSPTRVYTFRLHFYHR